MATKPNGAILWEGPSPLDGQPLVLIITGLAQSTENDKTGDMLQTWILRADVDPWTAFKGPDGYSNCGDCTHRLHRTCYVRWYQAPLSIWNAYKRGSYSRMPDLGLIRDRMLRIGSAGDPALVPSWVWEPLLAVAAGHTRLHPPMARALRPALPATMPSQLRRFSGLSGRHRRRLATVPGSPRGRARSCRRSPLPQLQRVRPRH